MGLSEDDANWPKGCYLSTNADRVYFNTHATGAANAGATPICSDAPFVLGAKNTNGIASYPDYYSIVDAEAECSTAAKELTGFSITIADVQAVADWPKGCYTWNGNPYFNTHATGAAHAEATPICARDASTEVDMWGRVADGFVLGAPGTLAECMDHYHVVDTEAECAKAAADLEESSGYGGTEDVDDFPKGCYSQAISTSGTQVFFNAYAAGPANADASPICAPDFVRGTFQGCPYNYPMISMHAMRSLVQWVFFNFWRLMRQQMVRTGRKGAFSICPAFRWPSTRTQQGPMTILTLGRSANTNLKRFSLAKTSRQTTRSNCAATTHQGDSSYPLTLAGYREPAAHRVGG